MLLLTIKTGEFESYKNNKKILKKLKKGIDKQKRLCYNNIRRREK